ncbi:MAG: hypothetical protein VKK04_05130 [Synechococcales bacterium]|nr:hypothetical protein [Synechococcales bacterium]
MDYQDPSSPSAARPPAAGDRPANTATEERPADQTEAIAPSEQASDKPSSVGQYIRKYWWLLPILLLVLVLGGLTVARLQEANEEPEVTETAPLSVRAVTAAQQPIRAWISSEGTVRAVEYQHLTFEVEGDVTFLADVNGRQLREGDRVQAGTLLARVDDRELVADVRQAEAAVAEARQQRAAAAAEVAQARAQVAQARSQVQEAEAQLSNAQSAQSLAATNLERYRLLAQEGAVAEIELDERQTSLEDAQAQVETARAGVASAQQQVVSAQAQVSAAQEQVQAQESTIETAQARLAQAEVALEGASIYAPFDGIIAYLNYTEGEYFTPQAVTSQLGGDYQGILERIPMVIIDPSRYEVIVELAGPTGEQVEIGQDAFVAATMDAPAPTVQGETYRETLIANARASGEVFAVNPAISPGGRAIEARIRLNPGTTEMIRHGERVLTWIAVDANPDAVVVPLDAVVRRDQVPYVFVVNQEEGIVEQRQVTLGITGITQQAIASGVEPGERVVTGGQNRLVDGAAVQVVNTPTAPSP